MTLAFPTRFLAILFTLAASFANPSGAGDGCECSGYDVKRLSKLCPDELENLFRLGSANCVPIGYARGKPLLMLDARHPRTRAAASGMFWKGKHFLACGRMVNQWVGFRAVEASVSLAPSELDGQPCIRIDYLPNALIFGGTFDEVREIAPGVLLGRFIERCPTPRLKGYFVAVMSKP